MLRSVGQADDIESLAGEMKEKKIELDLTIGGQVQPYVMTVRKYEMKRESGPRVVSRWVVQELQPKGSERRCSRRGARQNALLAAERRVPRGLPAPRSGRPGAWRRCRGTTPSA